MCLLVGPDKYFGGSAVQTQRRPWEPKDKDWKGTLDVSLAGSSVDWMGNVKVKKSSRLQVWTGFNGVIGQAEGNIAHLFSIVRSLRRQSRIWLGRREELTTLVLE